MRDALGLLAVTFPTLLGFCALLGLAVRFILMPYLREQLLKPVQETHRQVVENGHKNEPPTLPDALSDIAKQVQIAVALSQQAVEGQDRIEARLDEGTRQFAVNEKRLDRLDNVAARLENVAREYHPGSLPDTED